MSEKKGRTEPQPPEHGPVAPSEVHEAVEEEFGKFDKRSRWESMAPAPGGDMAEGKRRRRKILQESYNASIAALFRRQREDQKITIRQLGEQTGLSHWVLSRLETGQSQYTFDYLLTIAKALQVDVTEIPGLREALSKTVRWKETLDQVDRIGEPGPHVLHYLSGTDQFPERINLSAPVADMVECPRLFLDMGGDGLHELGYPDRSVLVFAKGRRPAIGRLVLALHRPSETVFIRRWSNTQLTPIVPKQLPLFLDDSFSILGSHVGTFREE